VTSRRWLGEGLALAALLVIAALVYVRGLDAAANYDEGVYLASLDALRHGQELGTDVYASQPPGFYVLLQALSLLPGDGIEGIRVAFLLVALIGIVAAYAIGRRLAGFWGGMGAAGLLAVTAPYPVQAPRVQADTASVAIALATVAVSFYAGRRSWRWAATGVLAGAAIAVKLLALPVLAPLAVLLIARRSWRAAVALAAGAAAVWAVLLVVYAGAVHELWQSVVSDHRDARDLGPSLTDNLDRVLLHPLDWRTPAAVLVVIGLVCAVVLLRRVELVALGAWIVASAAFLIVQKPLLDHHIVLLAATLAVPAGAGLGAAVVSAPHRLRLAVAGVAAVALALGFVQEQNRLADQEGDPPGVTWAAAQLRTLTQPDDLVGTDLPIVAYLADRRVPGQLIDSSFVRLETGSLTDQDILGTVGRQNVRTVVVGRLYAEDPHLMMALRTAFLDKWVEHDGVKIFHAPSP
jgi:4-amino-4-deoxy-L-arabinose transferase-like glycosyltransferase